VSSLLHYNKGKNEEKNIIFTSHKLAPKGSNEILIRNVTLSIPQPISRFLRSR